MTDHTYSLLSVPENLISSTSNLDDSTFNTDCLLENYEKEYECEYFSYSDCDNSDKDLDYAPPFQTLEVTYTDQATNEEFIDMPSCSTQEHNIFVHVDEDLPVEEGIAGLRKRRMTDGEKFLQKIKLQNIKNEKQKDKHSVIKKTCVGKCRNQYDLLNYEHQTTIWLDFWKLNYTERRKYMSKCINLVPIKRRKVNVDNNDCFRKNNSRFIH